MRRIPFKLCILLIVLLGIGVIVIGIYRTDSLNITDLDKQEKIIKIVDFYNFKWGPVDHNKLDVSTLNSNHGSGRSIRSSDENESSSESSSSDSSSEQEEGTSNTNININQCSSTIQGRLYIADDQGYVCLRSHWDSVSKCCKKTEKTEATTIKPTSSNSNSNSNNNSPIPSSLVQDTPTQRYSCKRCSNSGGSGIVDCCDSYEFCVSCCMRPDKITVLQDTLIEFAQKGLGKEHLKNQFDLCTMACRTSSSSLLNQREYQNPNYKFCFSSHPPPQTTTNNQ